MAISGNQYLLKVPTIEAIETLMAQSRLHQFQLESIVPQRQTLEDLYLKRMK
jgi:hypothetical protein